MYPRVVRHSAGGGLGAGEWAKGLGLSGTVKAYLKAPIAKSRLNLKNWLVGKRVAPPCAFRAIRGLSSEPRMAVRGKDRFTQELRLLQSVAFCRPLGTPLMTSMGWSSCFQYEVTVKTELDLVRPT